jgi:hypothetical protein
MKPGDLVKLRIQSNFACVTQSLGNGDNNPVVGRLDPKTVAIVVATVDAKIGGFSESFLLLDNGRFGWTYNHLLELIVP